MLTRVNKGVYMISKVAKEYLKTIYVLNKQNGEIRVTDIANKMNCSKPNVIKQLNVLKENNLINYETYGKIELTNKGMNEAKKILTSNDIIYILLNDVIGVPSDIAYNDASLINGVISEKTLNVISNYIYEKLELNKLNCNFNIKNETCRECISKRKETK